MGCKTCWLHQKLHRHDERGFLRKRPLHIRPKTIIRLLIASLLLVLAAVHNLATNNSNGTLNNTLAAVTGGVRLLSAANVASRSPDSHGLGYNLAAQFSPMAGNALDPFALIANKGANLNAAVAGCKQSITTCSFLAGISLRLQVWKSEKTWTQSTVSSLLALNDLTISGGRDVALMGGTVASANRDLTAVAGRNLGLAAVADNSRDKSSNWGLTLGFQPNGISIGADAAKSSANATVFSNAQATAGRDATFIAGQDMAFIGANVGAKNINISAGRDLSIISQQNVSQSSASSFNVGVTIAPGGAITGASIGGSLASGSRAYTDNPNHHHRR